MLLEDVSGGAVQNTQGCKMCTCSLTDLKYSSAGRSKLVMKHHIHIQPAAIALRTGFVTMIRLNYWMDENHESHIYVDESAVHMSGNKRVDTAWGRGKLVHSCGNYQNSNISLLI